MDEKDLIPLDQIKALDDELTKRIKPQGCPACGHIQGVPAQLVAVPFADGREGGWPMLARACFRCGHVRLHAVSQLQMPDPGEGPKPLSE